ncbi:MAG: type II toxin-antitoxin system HigB family toxin [Rhodobacteraceae bacterium]|nr:type II toxin-antitoxin system HigB family toxin [Paracoccaceae bacterium]
MNLIARSAFREFWWKHPQAERPLRALYSRLTSRNWGGPQEIKDAFGSGVDFVRGDGGGIRAIFNVSGNKYRVIIAFAFERNRGYVKFVGTHSEYDRIDAATVKRWTSDQSERKRTTDGLSPK